MANVYTEGTKVLIPIRPTCDEYVEGTICGRTSVKGLGFTLYTVRIKETVPGYPYTCMTAFESDIRIIHEVGV